SFIKYISRRLLKLPAIPFARVEATFSKTSISYLSSSSLQESNWWKILFLIASVTLLYLFFTYLFTTYNNLFDLMAVEKVTDEALLINILNI
ncbi:hypothetical protein L9F63_004624, partial [Diploptera punctata]